MRLKQQHIAIVVAVFVCIVFSAATGSFAYFSNKGFGFPLDDPWIHLQFAKNLAEHGSFSYYKDEMPTSGSTAPLYTLLAAAGFLVTHHEMILSYVLGVLAYIVAIVYFFKLTERVFDGAILPALAGTVLFALEPRLHWAALSGMETTLFIALLLAAVHSYQSQKGIMLGIVSGLLLWTRPEAVILYAAMAADWGFRRLTVPGAERKALWSRSPWLVQAGAIACVLGLGYAGFNLSLSGSILPNTYAAKLAYYSGTGTDFPRAVFHWLTGNHIVIVSVLAGGGILQSLFQAVRRQPSDTVLPLLFTVGLFTSYWMKLPYLYQNGRYMMPILPFVILLGLSGLHWMSTRAGERFSRLLSARTIRAVQITLMAFLIIQFALGVWDGRVLYQESCKYISDRQVRTALWIRDHLPQDAIVATHDVGALAYYSERRIVDMVGLISPEIIDHLKNLSATKEFLVRHNVTHLAVLRNWFEVVNVNPIFQTREATPEIMEVFRFEPDSLHFTSPFVAWLTSRAWSYLSRGDVREGKPLAERAVQLDSLSSRAHHHLGWALMMEGDLDGAEHEFHAALRLHPEYWSAHFALTQVPLRRGQPLEAVRRLKLLLKANPNMLAAYQAIAQIYGQMGENEKAAQAAREYQTRIAAQQND
ncbi:MAG: hypothetical protein HBSIN02_19680 [Bacteroidia bacterium]|nr:MAG: hypothetical protein HBSIN02_19680 [Bacteroidia bacterium]